MTRVALICCFVNYCALLYSQQITYSRRFDALKKNVPVAIINNHANYFHVLRYNKIVHDLTLERRLKPSAEIAAFTALKLDSINASWFDYEELDQLIYEAGHQVYFLFEKELNSKKTLYLKIIDSLGRSTGFIELASLEKDKGTITFDFEFKRTRQNNILIIGSRNTVNGVSRKVAMLFDVTKRKMAWIKKLPPENTFTSASEAFDCTDRGDLAYILKKNRFLGYTTMYRNDSLFTVPDFKLDSLFIARWPKEAATPELKLLNTDVVKGIKNNSVFVEGQHTYVTLQALHESADGSMTELFITYMLDSGLAYRSSTMMSPSLRKRLTFYDGPGGDAPHTKDQSLLNVSSRGPTLDVLLQRTNGYYSKELLYYAIDKANGTVQMQEIIPRKIFFFKNRTRFKNIATVMMSGYRERQRFLILEHPSNFKKKPGEFKYHSFKKETGLRRSNIVMYSLSPGGDVSKDMVYRNADFLLVPLKYDSEYAGDIVFYFSGGKYEKFGILQ